MGKETAAIAMVPVVAAVECLIACKTDDPVAEAKAYIERLYEKDGEVFAGRYIKGSAKIGCPKMETLGAVPSVQTSVFGRTVLTRNEEKSDG